MNDFIKLHPKNYKEVSDCRLPRLLTQQGVDDD